MDEALQERRLAVVREHMETENVHDFGATLATFEHPRYGIRGPRRGRRWPCVRSGGPTRPAARG
jgi:hypothetical protein